MTPRLLAQSCALLLLVSNALADPLPEQPACRLVARSHWIAKESLAALDRLIPRAGARQPGFAYHRVVLGSMPADPATLHLQIVSDAAEGTTDAHGCPKKGAALKLRVRDSRSVVGCHAGPGWIECSQQTLEAVAQADHQGEALSPGLEYLLAHELGHIFLGHTGHFSSGARLLHLDASVEDKLDLLDVEPGTILEREKAADAVALELLLADAKAGVFSDPSLSARAALQEQAGRVRIAADNLEKADLDWTAGQLVKLVDEPRLPADAAYVRWSSTRVLCDLLAPGHGVVVITFLDASHPRPATRLHSISDTLLGLSRQADGAGPNTQALPADLSAIVSDVGGITAKLDEEYDTFLAAFVAGFNGEVARARSGRLPSCRDVAREPPPKPAGD